ncbi:MAG: DUF1540 domain-containing protein [Desulfotomaculaceae bacterium]
MPNIKCNVTECDFNESVECAAPMIQVNRNHASNAGTSDQTKCETFKPKE